MAPVEVSIAGVGDGGESSSGEGSTSVGSATADSAVTSSGDEESQPLMKKRATKKVRHQVLDMFSDPIMQPSITATSGRRGMCNNAVRCGHFLA
ncbi:MAG: hypothetical protein AMJ56_14420 [Anaerolineae bacterium SG8_19]|nr:MAG: hypothetical protein AMJ56_14420 [Anaerolineae bacterium SG8_19]